MKSIWLIPLAFLLLPFGVVAQVNEVGDEDDLIESLGGIENLLEDGSVADVQLKRGYGNDVDIKQYGVQLAVVQQAGNHNDIELLMEGDHNSILVNQIGNLNQIDINLDGELTNISATQRGYGNKLFLDYYDTREVNANFIQDGYNIEVEHRAVGLEDLDYTIEFRGSNMNIQVVDLNNFIDN